MFKLTIMNTSVLSFTLVIVSFAQGFPRPAFRFQYSPEIVGGEPADRNEIPYQIALLFQGIHDCGGSILNENYILTAAHCVEHHVSSYTVQAGEYHLYEDDGTEQLRNISEIFVHEGYKNGNGTNANDIAILRLAEPLTLTEAVQSIALPKDGHISIGVTQTSGWGALASGGTRPDILYKVQVPIVDDATCTASYGGGQINSEIMICAGYMEGGKDSCQGDSGGPLVAYDDGEYLAGVVSWGAGCGFPKYPGVYTEVVSYLDWIEAVIR